MTTESSVATQRRHSHTDPSAITDMDHSSTGSSTWPLKSFLELTVWYRKQMSLRTQTQIIWILGPDHSAERETRSPSLLLHLHVHCAQEGLGEEVEESVRLLNHQPGDILRSRLTPWQCAWERCWGAGEPSKGAAALAMESPGNITFMILTLQHRETVVQYDEYSGRGGVLQGAKYVGNALLLPEENAATLRALLLLSLGLVTKAVRAQLSLFPGGHGQSKRRTDQLLKRKAGQLIMSTISVCHFLKMTGWQHLKSDMKTKLKTHKDNFPEVSIPSIVACLLLDINTFIVEELEENAQMFESTLVIAMLNITSRFYVYPLKKEGSGVTALMFLVRQLAFAHRTYAAAKQFLLSLPTE
ncbi:hypothetical protein Q9966_014027 [Columba livia]|nr:hypothetical protein Q9966_014027 [Columba livia]